MNLAFLAILVLKDDKLEEPASAGAYIAFTLIAFLAAMLWVVSNELYVYQTYDRPAGEDDTDETEWLNQAVTPEYNQAAYPAAPGIGWTDYPVA